jgi:hypothetical protein
MDTTDPEIEFDARASVIIAVRLKRPCRRIHTIYAGLKNKKNLPKKVAANKSAANKPI